MDQPTHHHVLLTLLEGKQFEACRMSCEALIEQELNKPDPSDAELARLYLILSRAWVGLEQYRKAAESADYAWCLARKTRNNLLIAEARYRAGAAYGLSKEYITAVERFTDALKCGETVFTGTVLYNRGFAYRNMGAYLLAVPDFEAAHQWAIAHGAAWRENCWINLVWVLILSREFERAEQLLTEFEQARQPERLLQLQAEHDRVHLSFLQGRHKEAVERAISALRHCGTEYPHIRAYTAISLLELAAEIELSDAGFAMGIFSKRLAARARRPDLDDEASAHLLDLECKKGPEGFTAALMRIGEIRPGAVPRTGAQRRG